MKCNETRTGEIWPRAGEGQTGHIIPFDNFEKVTEPKMV